MVIPLLSSLSAGARTAWPIIQRGVREGLSTRAIGRSLSAGGMGIRTQTLHRLATAERTIWQHGQSLKFLTKSSLPNVGRLPVALSKIRRQFSYTVELRGRSPLTGQSLLQHVTIATDQNMTREALESLASEMGVEGKKRYGLVVDQSVLVGGVKAGDLGVWPH